MKRKLLWGLGVLTAAINIRGRLINILPAAWQHFLSLRCGDLCVLLLHGLRRRVVRRNIELAFPELTPAECVVRVRAVLHNTGRILFDTLRIMQAADNDALRRCVIVDGEEHLYALRDWPVIMIVPHMLGMVIGGYILSYRRHPLMISYRSVAFYRIQDIMRPPVYTLNLANEERHVSDPVDYRRVQRSGPPCLIDLKRSGALRTILHFLRNERGILYYLPDVALREQQGVPSSFMGVPVYMPQALFRLARQCGARTVLCSCTLEADSRYRVDISSPLPDFPGDDERQAADRISRLLERIVRRHPDQYFWYHRRFKKKGKPFRADDPYAGL